MAKYKEGDTHIGRTGTKYMVQGGKWVAQNIAKVDPREDAEVVKLSEDAHNKRVLADASHDFMRMNDQTSTGPGRAIGFHLPFHLGHFDFSEAAQTTPGSPAYDPNIRAMEAINGRYAPQLRPVGSGRLTVVELDAFKKALPKITNGGEDNYRLTQQYEQEAQRARAEADFKRNYLHSTGSLAGAQEAFDKLGVDRSTVPMAQPAQVAAPRAAHQLSDAELMQAAGLH